MLFSPGLAELIRLIILDYARVEVAAGTRHSA